LLQPIPLNKGLYKNVDKGSLRSPEFAREWRNVITDESGAVFDRPALEVFATIGSYPIEAIYYWDAFDVAIVVSNRKFYSVTSAGVVTNITGSNLAGTNRPVFATDGTYLAIAGGGAPQQWSGSGNTASLAGSPPSTKWISYLDGYWILQLNDDQEFRWAGPTSSARATWSSANFFQAEAFPDDLVAQAVLFRELYGFGKDGLEIFQNYGQGSVPFQRTFVLEQGCEAGYSVTAFDNTLGFLNHERRIMQLQGRTPVHISIPIDETLHEMETVSDCWGTHIQIGKNYFAVWTFPTEEKCFAYDYRQQRWYEWDGFQNGESDRMKVNCHTFARGWNKHLVGDPVTGTVYNMTNDSHADASQSLRRLVRTGQYNHGTSVRKRSNFYLFDIKRGVGTPGDTEPVFSVRVNDDNKGWSEPQTFGLGYPGENEDPLRIHLRGIYRKRELEISMTDNAEFLLNGIEEDVDPLES
jgi:hypothetical protein